MDNGKAPKIRIVTGSAAELEAQINLLMEADYAPLERQWFVVNGEIQGVAVLLPMSEFRKADMMKGVRGLQN